MAKGGRKRKESTSRKSSSSRSSNSDTLSSASIKTSSSASHTKSRKKLRRKQASSQIDRVTREASSEIFLQRSLANLRTYIDNKFVTLTSNVTQDTTERVLKRLKYSTYDFKFKGNKDQFNFNRELELIDSLQEAVVAPQVDTLLKVVHSTIDSLKSRNKLIKLADNSEAGWDLVAEYKANENAANSDDDKRIRRAEKRALQKRNDHTQEQISNEHNDKFEVKYDYFHVFDN